MCSVSVCMSGKRKVFSLFCITTQRGKFYVNALVDREAGCRENGKKEIVKGID